MRMGFTSDTGWMYVYHDKWLDLMVMDWGNAKGYGQVRELACHCMAYE